MSDPSHQHANVAILKACLPAALEGLPDDINSVLLFGSRARGDATATSDWDVAVLAGRRWPVGRLYARLNAALRTDAVDVVDLGTAGARLRMAVARDGLVVWRRPVGTGEEDPVDAFRVSASLYWGDFGPVLERAELALLDALGGEAA